MTSYHELETSTYNAIQAKPCTKIPGKLDWHQNKNLVEEVETLALDCTVFYLWLHRYGLLAEIQEDIRYLAATGANYVELI